MADRHATARRPAAVLHWNGRSWQPVAGTPADAIDSVAPDGSGGLWATGVDRNPSGFNLFYHLTGRHWTEVNPPAGTLPQAAGEPDLDPRDPLAWGTATGLSPARAATAWSSSTGPKVKTRATPKPSSNGPWMTQAPKTCSR